MPDLPRPDQLPEGFALEALLAPLPGEAPAGPDLRRDLPGISVLARLRDAVAEARAAEREADSLGESLAGPLPQWRAVAQLAVEGLRAHSKDLEFAAALTEASVRQHGLRGLVAGAALIQGLAEAFWDGLHPIPDEDGVATRFVPVTGLSGAGRDGTLLQPLRRLAMFLRSDGAPFAWWQYQQSHELAGIVDEGRRAQRLTAGVLPFEELEALAQAVAPQLRTLRAEVAAARAAWGGMAQSLSALARPEPGPSTGRVAELLEMMADAAARLGPAAEEAPAAPPPSITAQAAVAAAAGPSPADAALPPMPDREAMLRQLSTIADVFRRTEPTSPLAYTLEEAVRRARMTWPELLAEVVTDERARSEILTALGIRPPQA